MAGIEILIEKLKHENPEVRGRAVHNLVEIGGKDVKPYLIKALKDKSLDVRIIAIDGFSKIGSKEDMSYLEKIAAKDPVITLREAAKHSLSIIKERANQNK
jgi:HEAT repeat protein